MSQVEKYYKSCIYRESCDYYVQDRAKYFELKNAITFGICMPRYYREEVCKGM